MEFKTKVDLYQHVNDSGCENHLSLSKCQNSGLKHKQRSFNADSKVPFEIGNYIEAQEKEKLLCETCGECFMMYRRLKRHKRICEEKIVRKQATINTKVFNSSSSQSSMCTNPTAAELQQQAEDIAGEIQKVTKERSIMRRSFVKYWQTLSGEECSSLPLEQYAYNQEQGYDSRIAKLYQEGEKVLLQHLDVLSNKGTSVPEQKLPNHQIKVRTDLWPESSVPKTDEVSPTWYELPQEEPPKMAK